MNSDVEFGESTQMKPVFHLDTDNPAHTRYQRNPFGSAFVLQLHALFLRLSVTKPAPLPGMSDPSFVPPTVFVMPVSATGSPPLSVSEAHALLKKPSKWTLVFGNKVSKPKVRRKRARLRLFAPQTLTAVVAQPKSPTSISVCMHICHLASRG